jgi:indole-3-glycerol phosphate synthase
VQASLRWTAPGGTLGTICHEAEARAALLETRADELEREASAAPAGPSLAGALRGADVRLVAEVKRRSPSKGAIAPALDAADLLAVRSGVAVPALKKDFHVLPIQLVEARALGASAALLIARALSPDRLREMTDTARRLDLEVLVEVRDEAELERALECGATMIGVNNRNLETLVIDPATAERLIPRIPPGLVAIAESGVSTREDVERFARCGADAVLVGSSISAAPDPTQATRALAGVPRRSRGD